MEYKNLEPFLNNVLEVNSNNKNWELHNDADFVEIQYNILERRARLVWNYPSEWFRKENSFKSDEKYLHEHNIQSNDYKIALVFDLVSIFEVKPRDVNMPLTEDRCLTDIRNFYEDDKGNLYDDGSINFIFESGMEIRINANTVTFDIETLLV